MSDVNRVKVVAEAIAAILDATRAFTGGTAHGAYIIGKYPSYGVEWAGFRSSYPDGRVIDPKTIKTTLLYNVDIYFAFSGDLAKSQSDFTALIQTARTALLENYRLNNTAITSRVVSGDPGDITDEKGLAVTGRIFRFSLEVDIGGHW